MRIDDALTCLFLVRVSASYYHAMPLDWHLFSGFVITFIPYQRRLVDHHTLVAHVGCEITCISEYSYHKSHRSRDVKMLVCSASLMRYVCDSLSCGCVRDNTATCSHRGQTFLVLLCQCWGNDDLFENIGSEYVLRESTRGLRGRAGRSSPHGEELECLFGWRGQLGLFRANCWLVGHEG